MKRIFLSKEMRSIKIGAASLALALMTLTVQGQEKAEHKNENVRLADRALSAGNFKEAEKHLLKALPTESKDPDVQYLLGYSQFHNGNFKSAISTFEAVLAIEPRHTSALYYKGMAASKLAVDPNSKLSTTIKEKYLKTAIEDYSKAIAVDANDAKLYQNRAIAYRDLGILKGTDSAGNYNKDQATDAYNKAIVDYEKVLSYDASRKDIQTEVKKAKVYRDNLK